MNLSALHTFLAIVETGSLVKASKRLNVTQSTITARLKNLEEELGQTLVNRQKSGVSLTTAGERLRRYASTMTELWRQAKLEAALPAGVRFTCNIGCHTDLWINLGEQFFTDIRKTHKAVALSVWQGGQVELENWINSGLIDVSISYGAASRGNLAVHSLGYDRLTLVSTIENSPIRFDPNYVMIEAGEQFGRDHATAYADAGLITLSFGSADLGLKHILKYGGSAYLPQRIAAPYLHDQRLFILSEAPQFRRQIYLLVNDRIAGELDIDSAVKSLQIQ
jgi:DNA-binding transcriptional LysR family regulator